MLGLEGFVILIIIALGVTAANYIVNRDGKKRQEKDSTKK